MLSMLIIGIAVGVVGFGLLYALDAFVLRPANARTAQKILDAERDAADAEWSQHVKNAAADIHTHNSANSPPHL